MKQGDEQIQEPFGDAFEDGDAYGDVDGIIGHNDADIDTH